MPSALALTHVAFEDPGTLIPILAGRGFTLRTADVCTAALEGLDGLSPDLLVVMGGPVGVYETQAYPFLEAEIALIRRRLHARRPTLGICLGAQLMAKALGAAVYPGRNGKEIGWSPIQATADAGACPAMAELVAGDVQVLHWHGDTFDLPPGAIHLATSAQYAQQAFCQGSHALGLQFHPEVQAEGLERWYVGHACELGAAKIDVERLRSDSLRLAPLLEQAAARFWQHWLDQAIPR